jgi:hypothetical protein
MITTYLNGRLGNNLFQYTFCRIASKKNNCNFYIPSTKLEAIELYDFCKQKTNINLEHPCESNPHFWTGENIFNIDFGINDFSLNKIMGEVNINDVNDETLLLGFYQTESYLIEYRDIIINDWLRFNDDLINKSSELVSKYDRDEYCYIHFRGTDYKNIPQYYLPIDYYNDSINYIKSINENIKFVVITDDVLEAKKFFSDYDVISNEMEVDFYLLSKSKYSIIPNSSFSWWASWLNDNSEIIVAPNRWFNYNNYYGDGFEPSNIKTKKFYYL